MAAPKGNTNSTRGCEWRDHVEWALKNYEGGKVKRGLALRAIAMKLVEDAISGDKSAREEIGNRLDGKPSQSITGPGGGPLLMADVTAEQAKRMARELTKD